VTLLCAIPLLIGFAVALPATWAARAFGRRLNALDGGGVAGQVKEAPRRVPNTGGIGIFLGVGVCLAGAILALTTGLAEALTESIPEIKPHLPGLIRRLPEAATLLAGLLVLHIIGVVDDRRPLGPLSKLAAMLLISGAVVTLTNTRLLELLDHYPLGYAASVGLTILWIVIVTNACNFLDNMDGLSGGVGAICASALLASALVAQQWFVACLLALVIGVLLGFLVFNFPWKGSGASVFMGDGGSLVIGFLLAFLSIRITWVGTTADGGATAGLGAPGWAVLTPLIVLAVPLYDFASVTLIRLSQGRSPFVGDLQHFSHRLVRHGLSRRAAVLVIYGCTAVTGIGAISLPRLDAWQAALVGAQTLLVLMVIALYEWARTPPAAGTPR
jgi:UDP-GlcNAc:undecaprenyl-phosphate GlcNAc-1-phosphate transferase